MTSGAGVSTDRRGRVTMLSLSLNQLTGTIPAELGNLANLRALLLEGNQLTGAIPAELGNLANLQFLFFGANQLTGAIPRNLMHLSALSLSIFHTRVCVPADAEFRAWLASLPVFLSSGFTCEGLLVSFTRMRHTVVEGGTVPVTVHLSAAEMPGRPVTIPLTAAPGERATVADFAGVPASVTFGPTDTTRTFEFEARADSIPDDGETVALGLGSPLPAGVTPGNPATAIVTLLDYDWVARDRETLEALYHATDGPNWWSRANWLSDEPLSAWAGVRTNGEGRVTRLALDRNRLRGEIPAALANLTVLESLALDRNELRGDIPRELGSLANLKELILDGNELTGPIPPELANLSRLERLALDDNGLTGAIPPELGRLAELRWLYLFDNELMGPIPRELGELANLEWLTLKSNRLTGPIPPELGNLASLETLGLWDNRLTGPIPPELGDLVSLVRLYLHDNELSGSVPDSLGGLANLEHLVLRGNPLSGPLPQSLTQLSALKWLDIDRTGVCVPSDAAFQAWLATIVDFRSSGFTCGASVTAAFGSARYTAVEGESVPVTVRLSRPAGRALTIALTADPGGGATVADYAGVPANLTFGPADAVRTFRVDALADEDTESGETVTLGIGLPLPDGITAGTPAAATVTLADEADESDLALRDRAALEALYYATGGPNWVNSTNWLTDAVLDEWFGVKTSHNGRVTRLDLGRNNLIGVLPPELGNLSDLYWLSLPHNQLSGSIPPGLGGLANLNGLVLWDNQLTGAIPVELGNLASLFYLGLFRNQLTGAIPAELGSLANLGSLDLFRNQLTGGDSGGTGELGQPKWLRPPMEPVDGRDSGRTGEFGRTRRLAAFVQRIDGADSARAGKREQPSAADALQQTG